MSFETLELSEGVLKAVADKGYKEPTLIQKKAIPCLLQGRDFLALAPTGSGKTAAFIVPILESIHKEELNNTFIHSLILAPTRELAIQIHESCLSYGKYLFIESGVVFGGVTPKRHVKVLKRKPRILIATPGRLLDLISKGYVDLSQVKICVLDEGDKLLDLKSFEAIKKIIDLLPNKRQNILLSATLSKSVIKTSKLLLNNPVEYINKAANLMPEEISQQVYYVEETDKIQLIHKLIQEPSFKKVLIFTRTKKIADKVCKSINSLNIRAKAIHGDKSQMARIEALELFKKDDIKVLIATDVAARGLDINQVTHVINMDIPKVVETYVHRIGRTGRGGFHGQAIALCSQEEIVYFKAIEKIQKVKIQVVKKE